MKLRARLALTVLVVAAPLLAAVTWLRADLDRRGEERAMREFAVARMESGGRAACEADPSFFALFSPPPAAGAAPGELAGPVAPPPPPPEGGKPPVPTDGGAPPDAPAASALGPLTQMWAYGDGLASANARAPEMPPDLAAALRSGAQEAGRPFEMNGLRGRQLAVRMAWTGGPCAFVLVRRVDPREGEFASFPLWSAAALVLAVLGVVVLAAGSVVRRIRRLTDETRRVAAGRYAEPVHEQGGDEISDLARAFNEAGAEVRRQIETIEKREATLRDFVANTTHDVMTPLTVLQGHLSAMRHRVAGSAADAELVNAAAEEAHYLTSLVHNLGAAAKLDAGAQQVQLAPVSLNEIVQRVVERHWPVASPRAIEIEFAVPERTVWLDADVTLLEQAVGNVVGNAVRYNRPGGHVAVILSEEGRCDFSIRVIDDGPGVPDEQLARLTDRAFRTDDARRRNPEGSGLGLDIARRVAAYHRLSLDFRRSEYGGLLVEFRGVRGIPPA